VKKPAELRAHLATTVPSLAKNPDQLQLFIEQGSIATKRGAGLSFEYRYRLQILITDYADPIDTLTIPLLVWIAEHQPDLIDNTDKRDKAISIEAEVLSNSATDILISIELSERVIVTATESGWLCTHVDEPPLPDLGGPRGWQTLLGEDVLFQANP
jgi:hypothetical protein